MLMETHKKIKNLIVRKHREILRSKIVKKYKLQMNL